MKHLDLILNKSLQDISMYINVKRLDAAEMNRSSTDRLPISLNMNENKYGCSPLVIDAVKKNLQLHISDYPDDTASMLREELSKQFNLSPSNFLVTDGSIEAINNLFRTFKSGTKVVIPHPSYWAYGVLSQIYKYRAFKVPLEKDFYLDNDKLIKVARENKANLAIICNPNNPTGSLIPRESICSILERLSETILVVDEAYAEYAGFTLSDLVKDYDNIIIIKTFSKAYGLAGLRIGYAIGPEAIIDRLSLIRTPFCVSSIAQIAACAALDDQEHLRQIVDLNRKECDSMYDYLRDHSFLKPYPSHANFILARSEEVHAATIVDLMYQRNILVRGFDFEPLNDYIRITLGTPDQNTMVKSELSDIRTSITHGKGM